MDTSALDIGILDISALDIGTLDASVVDTGTQESYEAVDLICESFVVRREGHDVHRLSAQ